MSSSSSFKAVMTKDGLIAVGRILNLYTNHTALDVLLCILEIGVMLYILDIGYIVVYTWHCCHSHFASRQFQFVVPCAQQGTTNLVHHWKFSVLSSFADQIGSIDSWHTGTKKSLLQGPVLAKKTPAETLEILTVVYSHWTCTTFFWSQSGINAFLKSSERKSIYSVLSW